MKVKLWGVRGSYPTPLSNESIEHKIFKALSLARPGDISSEEALKDFVSTLPLSIKGTYGGNTTTIEVRTSSGELIIVDCGSGLASLGKELMAEDFGRGEGVANIFVTHTHWDHIQGIPFFAPLYISGNRFNFYSPFSDIEERVLYQQKESHFPVSFESMGASKRFFSVSPDEYFYINGIKIFTKKMPHPGGSFGIRIEDGDHVFVYTSDCEFTVNEIEYIKTFEELFKDADVLIFDAQYTFNESVTDKIAWGHSSASVAIDIASNYNVKNLLLFHHDPNYDDEKLDSILYNAKSYTEMNRSIRESLNVDLAREGMVFEFGNE